MDRQISVPYPFTRKWDPTFPPHHITQMILRGFCGVDPKRASKVRSVFTSLPWELACFQFLTTLTMPAQHRWAEKEGVLWPELVRYAFDPNNNMLTFWDFSQYENTVEPHLQSCIELRVIPCIGHLGMALEGADKRRIFIIGNYVKQRLLKPFHDWLFEVLCRIPMDGTFNQTRPLDYLVGAEHCYSFDLKSATDTDRWPLLFLMDVVKILFGEAWAKGVVNSTLATSSLCSPSHTTWCAEQVYPGPRFTNYAVLGDDIVITDSRVAEIYEAQLERLGVTISRQKSLVSHTGALEFAKRFRVRGGRRDLSPVSICGLLNYFHPSEMKPKDLKLAPHEFDLYSEDRDLVEYTAVRSDNGYSMYAGTAWVYTQRYLSLGRNHQGSKPGYLLGMRDGTEFLVSSIGLNQPAAGRGVVYPGVTIISGNTPKMIVTYKMLPTYLSRDKEIIEARTQEVITKMDCSVMGFIPLGLALEHNYAACWVLMVELAFLGRRKRPPFTADGVRRSSLPDRASVLNLPSRDSEGSSEPVKKENSLASGSGDLGPYLAEMRRFQKRCTKDPAGYFITWTANPSPSFYRTRKEDCFSEESYGKSVPIDSINKQLSDFEVVEEIEKERVDEPGLQNVMILWILLTLSVIGKT
ncbi:hypothetical protein BUALT_Bualt15G0128700 [Buddleja alternifolia]|uniref:RNA-dependent RNA polymerase n=1 Tax=Buddleja alternifolia TaxID=168488 RepID=A0AAV6WGN9_9LAMI|nr:hypothetical protein BUALT_Bualt15G0128700 [Buddleja alternifolia]